MLGLLQRASPLGSAGAYVLGVEVRGRDTGAIASQDLDRTLIPWWPKGTASQPLLVTTLLPISGRPERDASGALLREDLGVDMSPSGRLDNLVRAAEDDPVGASTLVIDPEVVEAASDMSHGYEVRTAEGDTVQQHIDDTLSAGAGLCVEEAVRVLVSENGPLPDGASRDRPPDLSGMKELALLWPGDIFGELALQAPAQAPRSTSGLVQHVQQLSDDEVRALLDADKVEC